MSIYFDNAATSPLRKEVIESINEVLLDSSRCNAGGGGTGGGSGDFLYKDFDDVRHHAGLAQPDPIYGETITVHHLRHALATRRAQSGATRDELMTVGGWKTTSQAERYLHLVNERAKTALLRLHK